MGRDEMKMDVLVAREPAIRFGLVGVQIVQDDVQLAIGIVGDEAVHKMQKFDPPAAAVVTALDQSGGDLKGGEQRRGAVAFVIVAEPGQRFAIGQLQPALGPLQRLDVGLFIDRQDHRIVRR